MLLLVFGTASVTGIGNRIFPFGVSTGLSAKSTEKRWRVRNSVLGGKAITADVHTGLKPRRERRPRDVVSRMRGVTKPARKTDRRLSPTGRVPFTGS